jgi:putative endonuclease
MYVVECNAHGKPLYTGISKNVAKRVETHNAGKGAKYVKGKLPVVLVATWEYPDKSTALKAEYAFKHRIPRLSKQIYIQSPELWDWENPVLEKRHGLERRTT